VSAGLYESDFGGRAFSEAHGVLAGHPAFAQHPLVCRWPQDAPPAGIVVFCHGLGSNGGEYAALSGHWAANGYLVVHPTFSDAIATVAGAEPHLGLDPRADLSAWTATLHVRARMHEILHTPERWLERVALVGSLMDALPGILDETSGAPAAPLRAAIAGHSFGAFTAQLLAGARIDLPGGRESGFRDERFAAAALLSAQGRDQQGLRDGSWDTLSCPMLNVTGTLDRGAKGGDWNWKCEPYELAPAGGKYLAVLEDGDHFLGGFIDREPQRQVPAQQQAVKALTLAFLDAHLRGRPAARDWLASIDDHVGACRLLFKRK